MGSFAGHALPGSFFLLFGIWSIVFQLKKYYRRKRYELGLTTQPESVYRNQITTPCSCSSKCCPPSRSSEIPLDSIIKVSCCAIGIVGEVYTGFVNGKFIYIGNAQHSSMFSMFLLAGIFEIISFYRICKLPTFSDYIFNFLALMTEGILFVFHLHGRTPTDVYLHTLLIYAVLILIVTGLYEAIYPHSHLAGFFRSILIMIQGTWFWHVGAILYPPVSWLPVWDEMAVESIPRATNIFISHVLVVFAAVVIVSCIFGSQLCGVRPLNSPVVGDIERDGRRRLLDCEDDSDDVEEMEVVEMRKFKTLMIAS